MGLELVTQMLPPSSPSSEGRVTIGHERPKRPTILACMSFGIEKEELIRWFVHYEFFALGVTFQYVL